MAHRLWLTSCQMTITGLVITPAYLRGCVAAQRLESRLCRIFYYALLGCYSNALVNCDGTQSHQLVATLVENVFGQTLGLVCGVYTRGSPSCEALPALDRVDPSELVTDSFILPLVTLANRLKYSRVVRVYNI
ncbi:hypothetical protein HPB48_015365 [Haemaphysalis longicornis]|uniref:Uncharacterized protein n=1 Tax=Haemaphysalis longicornis TaxID=44386 RepID=A0A9J6GLM7_HAELO|nr:hypothetical protein HPB48_015365 [Haemaphysalis longicornis]